MKVFIVEDSEDVRSRLIEDFGERAGIEVAGYAESEREAVEKIRAARPEAVILDIQLKDGSGLNVLLEVKEAERPPLVIVLTNFAYAQYFRKCMEYGADHFFDKTTEFMKVREVLERLAGRLSGG